VKAASEYPKARSGLVLGKGSGFVRIDGLSGTGTELDHS
jgi:hypothetical protein